MTIRPIPLLPTLGRPLVAADQPAAILAVAVPPVISIAATSASKTEGQSGTTAFTFDSNGSGAGGTAVVATLASGFRTLVAGDLQVVAA